MEKTMMAENEKMTSFAREGAHYDNLIRAADYFGVELQTCKTVEEIGEFLAELGRMMNGRGSAEKLIEEMGDVYNMLDQLCYLLGAEDAVREVAEQKMERTTLRIAEDCEGESAMLTSDEVGALMTRLRGAALAEFADEPDFAPLDGLVRALFDGGSRRGNKMARRMVHAVLDELGITYGR